MKHAVIIDDNYDNMLTLMNSLHEIGFQVTLCHAITNDDLPDTVDADIVFLDLELPNQNGYDIAQILRNNGTNAPLVAYSVHVDELPNIRKQGFAGLIAKPFLPEKIPHAVDEILAGKKVWLT